MHSYLNMFVSYTLGEGSPRIQRNLRSGNR